MDRGTGRLTVFFEDPFWVGVFERVEDGKLSACRVVFGAEPKDWEVRGFIEKYYYRLKFSPAVAVAVKETGKNPKRIQREARREVQSAGIGTRSQQALKLQQEQSDQKRKAKRRQERQEDEERRFELRQQKRKAKHRGR